MKRYRILVLAMGLCLAAGSAFADLNGDMEAYFNDFLGRLTARHPALETLTMPDKEVRGLPGSEDPMEAVIILTFAGAGEQEVFKAALEVENIPLATFPGEDRKILLFGIDMATFIMQDAIGL
jgi:hypothetical protein